MPKLIDYPRTSYTGAWELAEIVDDTGGKCAIDTAARKLNRKVSGSFKAIIGSAVKFGLMTSKRELLTTTTLFRRIKHAYDKAEELQFHREAFLTPPLFTQLCRKFRTRELPVQMLDVMLIREFGVEEINAQNVAKSFVDGCRMCGLIDERNIIADIDAINNNRTPRRELASPPPTTQSFEPKNNAPDSTNETGFQDTIADATNAINALALFGASNNSNQIPQTKQAQTTKNPDAVASLFGFHELEDETETINKTPTKALSHYGENDTPASTESINTASPTPAQNVVTPETTKIPVMAVANFTYQMQMSGPGVKTSLDISEEDDIAIAIALLEKIRRQLRANNNN